MNRKNNLPFILLFLLGSVLTISSCKKEDEEKSPTDADKLVGEWNVSHLVVGDAKPSEYKCTITKQNDSMLTFTAKPSPTPKYFWDMNPKINWAKKTLVMPGTTISGTIKNENDFELHYTWSGSATIQQHYTRQ